MRNRSRRRRGSGEINLTPLLDVLFTILFIVMLTGTQNEKTLEKDAEASMIEIKRLESEAAGLEDKILDLEEQNRSLQNKINRRDKIEDSNKRYESNAVIITFLNEVENGYHVLRIYTEQGEQVESFRLGTDRTEYTRNHVSEIISDIAEASVDRPVFIVFHCDAGSIYRKEEFNPIRDALEEQKKKYKEVFYQIVEE